MMIRNALDWARKHPSILIGAMLMLASSGLDGAYMTRLMPHDVMVFGRELDFGWLGLVMNLAIDATNLYLSERVGKFMRSTDKVKQWLAVGLLLVAVVGSAWFSWSFSFWQVRLTLPPLEPNYTNRQARFLSAAIPFLLVMLGLEDGLSNWSTKRFGLAEEEEEKEEEKFDCPVCGESFPSVAARSGHMNAHKERAKSNGERVNV